MMSSKIGWTACVVLAGCAGVIALGSGWENPRRSRAAFAAHPQAVNFRAEDPQGPDTNERPVGLGEAPEAVRNAALRLVGNGQITSIVAEEDEGITTYEIEYLDAGVACAAVLSAGGDVIEVERAVPQETIPPAVYEALRKDFPTGAFASPQAVTRTYFEIAVTVDGVTRSVKIDAAGDVEDDEDRADGERDEPENDAD